MVIMSSPYVQVILPDVFSVATTPLPTSLLVSCIGYKPCKWMIDKARQQVVVNIRLEADTTLLAGVVVTSG